MTQDWSRYWRSPDRPLEAMHARFTRHVYHRHSHETYSFGVTEEGAQSFTCRGAGHTSAAGMVMAFNPDDPHDGHAASAEIGFTYRMVHLGPDLVAEVLSDRSGRPAGLPLFDVPVIEDPAAARALRSLHAALLGRAPRLRRDELLDAAVAALAPRAPVPEPRADRRPAPVRRVTDFLHAAHLEDVGTARLAEIAGTSRFALYRAFRAAHGLSPADYQRQLRLRTARRLLAEGRPIAEVAAATGFHDQSHLTRWFARTFGVTPGVYRRAARPDG